MQMLLLIKLLFRMGLGVALTLPEMELCVFLCSCSAVIILLLLGSDSYFILSCLFREERSRGFSLKGQVLLSLWKAEDPLCLFLALQLSAA